MTSNAEIFDVLIVGSGAAGATAALRAADLGLSVAIMEKAPKFGGTSATSGGVLWIPNHGLPSTAPDADSREESFRYLDAILPEGLQPDRLAAFVDQGPEMVAFLRRIGIALEASAWPDYFPEADGARSDRAIVSPTFDGRKLGEQFPLLREQYPRFKLLNRYAMDVVETFGILARAARWPLTVAKIITRYWADFSTRKISNRDRRFTMGNALMGRLFEQIFARGVCLKLDMALESLCVENDRVIGVKARHFGAEKTIKARLGVILCAGGFEWNQELRDRFFTIPGRISHSSTPEGANRGDALIAGMNIGAATEHVETGWWIPTMSIPMPQASNFEQTHQAAFDVGRPHSVCVNRLGLRFVDEACGYDRFGKAMLDDHLKTQANTPCWLIFDARFRRKFTAGGLMPTILMPDSRIPRDWWDHYLFRANTIEALAQKIGVPTATLQQTVQNMNRYAIEGVDPEFGRGGNIYDQMFGDASVSPNPCLGVIDEAPFYAVQIQMGDIGTKGGLKSDAQARVLDLQDRPIAGLYAAGNVTGSPFGDCYPGAGGTIGPAMTFGFVAANHIGSQAQS